MSADGSSESDRSGASPALYRLLASSRRRTLLSRLRSCDGPLHLSDLARDVAAQECGSSPAEVPAERAEEVRLSLYHHHVPKLEDHDLVAYDRDRNAVALAERAERLPSVLEPDGGRE